MLNKKMATGLVMGGLMAVGAMSWTPATMAASAPGVEFLPESKIWMEGDSTLHAYKSTSKNWQIKATVTPGKAVKIGDITELEVVIPVKGLKSGDGALDGNMYNAMGADKNPNIRFNLSNAKVNMTPDGEIEVEADGKLNINGKEKATEVKAKGEVNGNTIRIKGSKELKMSEFGVNPPVLMFGAIKVADKITVKYDLVGKLEL